MSKESLSTVCRVPCRGGPMADGEFAVHTWKGAPVPDVITYTTHPEGRHVYRRGVYAWEANP